MHDPSKMFAAWLRPVPRHAWSPPGRWRLVLAINVKVITSGDLHSLVSDAIDFFLHSEIVQTGEREAEKEADPAV